jgi:hypothetical protein
MSPALVTDQNLPGYDVVRLIEATDASVVAIFEGETRDGSWAPARESALKKIVSRDLEGVGAKAELAATECHHSTCKLLFAGSTLEEARWGSILMQYATLGSFTEPAQPYRRDGRVYLPVYVAFHPEERGEQTWSDYYQQKRRAQLDRWRRVPPRPGYPPVPED